jgi:hypothetical protein
VNIAMKAPSGSVSTPRVRICPSNPGHHTRVSRSAATASPAKRPADPTSTSARRTTRPMTTAGASHGEPDTSARGCAKGESAGLDMLYNTECRRPS